MDSSKTKIWPTSTYLHMKLLKKMNVNYYNIIIKSIYLLQNENFFETICTLTLFINEPVTQPRWWNLSPNLSLMDRINV